MKKFENLTTADEMISAEIQKIDAGNRNEGNLLRLVFLTEFKKAIENSWARMNSSRAKEDSQYTWRAVANQIKWLQTLLLQGKSIAMTSDLDALKNSNGEAQQIEELKNQRDVTKADFYKGLKYYDRFIEEQKSFKRDDLYDDRIEMSAKDVLEIVKTFNEDEKLAFWLEYFTLADKFIYVPQSETSGKGQMGE